VAANANALVGASAPRAGSRWKKVETVTAALFIVPFFTLMIVFVFFVFFSGAVGSFTDAQGINEGDFVGLANYGEVLASPDFWLSARNTLVYTIGCLVTQVPIAFVLAYILNNLPKGIRGPLRASFFVPVLINSVIIALLFRMLFNRDQGVINWVLGLLGLANNTDWIADSSFAIPLLVIVSFWQWMGFHMVYFLANLQTIDQAIYEAARIDGASHLRVLVQIVMPMMRSAFTFVLVTSAIGCLQLFDLVFLVFPNATYGPGGSAKTLVAYIYDQAFSQQFRKGYASAVGWVVFFLIFAVSIFQLKVLGLGKQEERE
jgi:ABC-type sugar transport system permease subunit